MEVPANAPAVNAPSLRVRIGNFLFHKRNFIFPLVLAALLLGFPPVPLGGSPRADRWMDALGIAVILVGQGLRAAVIGYAYIRRGGKQGRIHADDLVTAGLFAHARNPLYVGNLLELAGLFLIHNNPWVYVLGGGAFLFAYGAIVAAEEAYLAPRYGDAYADYCRRVPRWIPNLRGLRTSLAGMRFNWAHVVLMEYGSTYSWFLAVLLLLGDEALREPGFPGRPLFLGILILLLLLPLPFWIGHELWKPVLKRHRRRLDTEGRFR